MKLIIGIIIGAIFDDYVIAFLVWALNAVKVAAAG